MSNLCQQHDFLPMRSHHTFVTPQFCTQFHLIIFITQTKQEFSQVSPSLFPEDGDWMFSTNETDPITAQQEDAHSREVARVGPGGICYCHPNPKYFQCLCWRLAHGIKVRCCGPIYLLTYKRVFGFVQKTPLSRDGIINHYNVGFS